MKMNEYSPSLRDLVDERLHQDVANRRRAGDECASTLGVERRGQRMRLVSARRDGRLHDEARPTSLTARADDVVRRPARDHDGGNDRHAAAERSRRYRLSAFHEISDGEFQVRNPVVGQSSHPVEKLIVSPVIVPARTNDDRVEQIPLATARPHRGLGGDPDAIERGDQPSIVGAKPRRLLVCREGDARTFRHRRRSDMSGFAFVGMESKFIGRTGSRQARNRARQSVVSLS